MTFDLILPLVYCDPNLRQDHFDKLSPHMKKLFLEKYPNSPRGRPARPEGWRSASCEGEVCSICGFPADAKVGEEIMHDDPDPARHNLTAYICANHFFQLFGPAADDILKRPEGLERTARVPSPLEVAAFLKGVEYGKTLGAPVSESLKSDPPELKDITWAFEEGRL